MIASSGPRKCLPRRGAAAVEFALVAPLFLLLIFGIIECGRMLMVQEILVNVTREGARAAIIPGETDAQVATTVSNYLTAVQISGGTTTLSPTLASGPASGTALKVTVSVPCATVNWVTNSTWFQGQILSSTVIMIKE
ncbi:MAG: TadE family protein [Planctomycetota bacterium]